MLDGGGWMKAGGGGGTQSSLLRQKALASSLTRSGLERPDSAIGVAGGGGAGWGLDRYQGMDPNGGRRTRVGGGTDADGAAGGGKLIDVSAGRVPQAQGKLAASIGAGAGLTGAGEAGHGEVLGGSAQHSSHLAKPDAAAVGKIHRAPKGQYVLRTETRVGRADIAMDDVSASSACIVLHDARAAHMRASNTLHVWQACSGPCARPRVHTCAYPRVALRTRTDTRR